jgi:hypothetical protein
MLYTPPTFLRFEKLIIFFHCKKTSWERDAVNPKKENKYEVFIKSFLGFFEKIVKIATGKI